MLICIHSDLHDVGVSARAVSDVVKWSAFNRHVRRVDPAAIHSGKLPTLELANIELTIAPKIAAIIKVDVSIPASAINPIVRLLGRQLNRTGPHLPNKIITDVSHLKYRVSILFYAIEGFGLLQGTPQTGAVFDVAAVAAYAGVEDVLQRVFAEEEVAQHSDAASHLPRPQPTQLGDCINFALLGSKVG